MLFLEQVVTDQQAEAIMASKSKSSELTEAGRRSVYLGDFLSDIGFDH